MSAPTRHRVAQRLGIHIDTLRYYERRGLIPAPPRSEGNYRLYDEETVLRVRFVKHAQELGFSLREIKELLALRASPRSRCGSVRNKAKKKLEDIEGKIKVLRKMKKALHKLVDECDGRRPATECPVLDNLDGPRPLP